MRKFVTAALLSLLVPAVLGGEEKKKPEPPKIVPVSEEEKAKLLDAETPEQKKLREELAAPARTEQKIVFNSNATGKNHIFMVKPDGSGLTQITKGDAGGSYPHLSPDGKRIVFGRNETVTAEDVKKLPFDESDKLIRQVRKKRRASPRKKACIWIMNADGTGAERVAAGGAPHWSANGKAVAYHTDTRPFYAPAVLDLEKRTEKVFQISGVRGKGQCMPAFSPDGKWLLTSNGPVLCWPLGEGQTELAPEPKIYRPVRGHVCNTEFGPKTQYITYVIDTHKCMGSWLCCAKFDPSAKKPPRGRKMKLGWKPRSVNYFPDFSPCGKYMVYVHADTQEGVKSWLLKTKQELYVSRFPPDGVNVRITWNGAANQHPHWWGPPTR
jgi:hypothetical protein